MAREIEYIETTGEKFCYKTNAKLDDINDVLYFDFLPMSGNPTSDGWYYFIRSLNENNLVLCTSYGGYQVTGNYTYRYANYGSTGSLPMTANTLYNCVFTKSAITLNDRVIQITTTYMPTDTNIVLNGFYADNPTRCPIARYYGFKIMNGNTLKYNVIPVIDDNDVLCFYDTVNDVYTYQSGSGTPIAGPTLHIFSRSPKKLKFPQSGGTSSIEVTAETGWTCTTPTGFTMSTTSGESGTTIISVTAPEYSGSTKKSEIVTFTDDDGYTFYVTLKQMPLTVGLHNVFLGTTEADFCLGNNDVSAIYLGEDVVYQIGTKQINMDLFSANVPQTQEYITEGSTTYYLYDKTQGYYEMLSVEKVIGILDKKYNGGRICVLKDVNNDNNYVLKYNYTNIDIYSGGTLLTSLASGSSTIINGMEISNYLGTNYNQIYFETTNAMWEIRQIASA